MTKKQFYILLSVLLIAILIFSNPSEEIHLQSVKSKLKIAYKKKINSEKAESFSGLGELLGNTIIDKLADGFITRENYILFSLTSLEYKGEEKTIGVGFLGNVFISNKVENIFNQNEQKKEETGDIFFSITKSIENTFKQNKQSEVQTENLSESEDKQELTDEEFKETIPSSNPNSNKYEFTSDMLLYREFFDNHSIDESDEYLSGTIIKVLSDFGGMIVKTSENYEMEVGFDSVKYDGNSKMCSSCEEDFKELIKVGRKIKFKVEEQIYDGTAYANMGVTLSYINIIE